MEAKEILILGGGFGSVRAALDLDAKKLPGVHIRIVSNQPHFEYHAALYRVVTGRSPLEVCIPLSDIFEGTSVEVVEDTVVSIDRMNKVVSGESGATYKYDDVILGLGSETSYFNIPGLKEFSFGFKSIHEALRLKRHIHEILQVGENTSNEDMTMRAHIVVIGGGASGVELAGDLAVYVKKLAKKHKFDESLVKIDLIEAAPRLLPMLSEKISEITKKRLEKLGVKVMLEHAVMKEEVETVFLKDMEMKTKTVIWTSGVKPHELYSTLGLTYDKRGRVVVDEHMRADGDEHVYVIGDAASTKFTGMAQTAVLDATCAVENIAASSINGTSEVSYSPKKPIYAIPVGPRWSVVSIGPITLKGRVGWCVRRFVDLRFFLSILPIQKAFTAFKDGGVLCESCPVCAQGE